MSDEGMRLTRNGLDVLAKACSDPKKGLNFTKVKFGDALKAGVVVDPTPTEILSMNALINEVAMTLPITDIRFGGNGTCVVSARVDNANLKKGFWAREVGLFASDPDSGKEILYSYKNFGELASYIQAGGGSVSVNTLLNLVTVIDQATNVSAVVNGDLMFVSQTELTNHINSTRPHPNVPNVSSEVSASKYFWAVGDDTQLHPVSAGNLSTQLLGDNASTISALKTRLGQSEINIANLFMQLNAEKDLGLQANLLLVEDFTDCESVDMFSVKAINNIQGGNFINVESIDGVREGLWYTLSDGVRSQYVRVKSIAKNADSFAVFFEEELQHHFTLSKTKLYRSTGLIYDNKISGAGEVRSSRFLFPDVWTGETAQSTATLPLTTTNANSKNFTLSGDYDFTPAGEFTLK